MKRHMELVGARKYYGKHATGTVLLVNGHPEFHGPRNEAVQSFKNLNKGKKPCTQSV